MRLFTAIGLGQEAHRELAGVQQALRERASFGRWQPMAQAHMTLHFLGEVPISEIEAIQQATAEAAAAHRPFELALGPLGAFPSRRKPRVLWVGVEGELDPLHALQADLKARLEALGLAFEARSYSPHLTLAREPREPVDLEALATDVPIARVPWRVERIGLFQSQLTPRGAIHTALLQPSLGAI